MENIPFIDGLPIKHGDFPWQTVLDCISWYHILELFLEHISNITVIYDKRITYELVCI